MSVVRLLSGLAVLVLLAGCAGPAVRRGLAYYGEGRYDSALAEFNDAVGRLGTDADMVMAYNDRAIVRSRIGDLRGAADDYTRALAIAPGDATLWFNRANTYTIAGIYANAIADYTRAVELRPTYTEAFFNRGTARQKLGDLVGARSDWRYAIEMEPDPFKRQAMERATGLGPGVGAPLAASPPPPPPVTAPGTTIVVPPPPMPPPAAVPPAAAPPAVPGPRSSAPPPLATETLPMASPASAPVDARALATRALSRELDGDRAGAVQDLRAALSLEADPARRAHIESLLRLLDGTR